MSEPSWHERFFGSTKGRIVALLRRKPRTVDDLAQSVHLTDNGVRSHLALLERDGLVRQRGLRRGIGKPAHLYELTPEAERLFPKAYPAVLGTLLDVLAARVPDRVDSILTETGRRLAVGRSDPDADLRERARNTVDVLQSLGGVVELEDTDDGLMIRGNSCPLSAIVPEHPAACHLAEALVSELVGAPVEECCDRAGQPRCRFSILSSGLRAEHPSA